MPHYSYLIIGAGMAADAAVRGIRDVDPDGSIGVIGAEIDSPYKRPPLTKGLWKGDPEDGIWYDTASRGAELLLGRRVAALKPAERRVFEAGGASHTFDKLLLATGGTPRPLPFMNGRVIYFRTVADYRRLRALTRTGRRFAVIGGGFIGSEIAAALAMNGLETIMVFPGPTIGGRVFPPGLGSYLNDYYRQKGVEVLSGESAVALEPRGSQLVLVVRNGQTAQWRDVPVDGVVAGVGLEPNTELARNAGLAVGDGIEVDEQLRTSHPDIYAAGDAASFHNPALGKRIRVEHEDNAKTMGRAAGRAMAGRPEPYRHLPFFYSDLFDLGYEAVGELDATLETVEDWKEPCREGVVYYLRAGRVRGVLLWNVWERVEAARRLIGEPGPFRPEDLLGRLLRAA